MKRVLIGFAALLGATLVVPATSGGALNDDAALLDAFAWLEGEWTRESRRGTVTEEWKRVSDVTMEGTATVTSDGVTRVTEYLRIEVFGDEVFYTAKPGENPLPTPFKLIESDGDRFLFENEDHDFPQRIIYTRDGEGGMTARIEGSVDGEQRGIDFQFRRRESGPRR